MKVVKSTANFGLALVILALPLLGWWQAQAIDDWWRLHNYTPPSSVTDLANEDTMTPQGVHDFYVNHPQLVSGVDSFRQSCPESEQAIVLGCYHPKQNGIYIYKVNDVRLTGVEQVTAAHEMLHAAYDRLSNKEKKYIDGLLQDYYNHDLNDQRIKDEISSYKKTEPNDVVNEMHSVFGTEASNLPSPLEGYYKRYFSNRAIVVGFSNNYQGEFTTRIAEIEADKSKLNDLKTQISAEEADLQSQLDQINSDKAKLDSYKASGQARQYNALVGTYNSEVDSYNSSLDRLQADINNYNDLVNNYNSIATDLASLEKALDTRLSTQPAQ